MKINYVIRNILYSVRQRQKFTEIKNKIGSVFFIYSSHRRPEFQVKRNRFRVTAMPFFKTRLVFLTLRNLQNLI